MSFEDFWDDCRKEPSIEQSNLVYQFKHTYQILSQHTKVNQKFIDAVQYCNQMHLKARTKDQRRPQLSLKEMIECTWKPNIIRNKAIEDKLTHYYDESIYMRGIRNMHRHNENIFKKMIESKQQNTIDNTFKPMINKVYNRSIFKTVSDTCINLEMNKYSKKRFMERYRKVRESENQMRSLSQIKSDTFLNRSKNVNRSLSAKQSFILKQTLHDELMSTGAYDE